ncbi:PTS fructose transporter subunit IIABC [Pediococcus stilesii]|uniref:Fusion of IIA, IIB and IIC component of mannitol fructose-specific phosphotransferase system n=1 Tax=Pediococcus stilesii TaxID=331679 RepID=A0A0R2L601_9LACO|nr:fructose-specific PTS transporter subunit EIIC [Pediococcus stilesii]KRN94036.1 fusion of IIA, IIB and IIC component of mannitol fructose-specific phosphotransferase system [Pediococcus stilesii]
MKIKELLKENLMIMNLTAKTKDDVINEMIDKYVSEGIVTDRDKYLKGILDREAESTTGIGDEIAMPHAKTNAVTEAAVLFAKSSQGVDFDSLDGKPVKLFFMIAAPEGANNAHLQALAKLSSLLIDPDLVAKLKETKTPQDVIELFEKAEQKKDSDDAKSDLEDTSTNEKNDKKPFIVAVSACPNGIAHTYMAEAALKKAAKEKGIDIKVETNGSEGIKHRLTKEEIERADGVIVTADKKVEMARFNGKPLLNRPVIDGINKADELIDLVEANQASTFHSNSDEQIDDDGPKSGFWNEIYKDLMNGISHMLPFVVGGGIIMAISFFIERYTSATSMWFTFPNNIGNYAFSFLIPILAGFIAQSIGDLPALMPGVVGGYMATQSAASIMHTTSVSGFIGGLIAGFAAGLIINALKKAFRFLPKSLEGLKPMLIYPIISLLLVGGLMFFIVNPIFASVNAWVTGVLEGMGTGNAVLLGAVLAGMMSIDMGGPFNKAAYAFAIAAFTSTKNGDLMAAVMVGGMIPPLATAIATTFWPKKFTKQEREAGISNWVLGISFITEGAIPFATADPLRVIGSSIIGSAIGGGLSQLWKVSVPAPHGGLWVLALADHKLFYILSVLIGAVIAGVIMGIWKPQKLVKNK